MSFDLKLENGDIKLGSSKDLDIVENSEKLIQDLLKIITTELGANQYFPWYGCPISSSMIGRGFDSEFVKGVATSQLTFSITNLQRMQQEQLKENQIVTPQESIAAIQSIEVDQNTIDPRFFNIKAHVLTKALRRVTAPIGIKL